MNKCNLLLKAKFQLKFMYIQSISILYRHFCKFNLQKTNTFPELVKVLSHFCRNPVPDDPIALEAAVLLGRLCVDDENARAELKRSLESPTSDTHKKAKVSKSSKTLKYL